MLTVRFLGGASIESDVGPLTGPASQRHRLALLALLATCHPGGLGRDKLLAYLWPTRDTESARHLLNQSVYVLRKKLGEEAIHSVGEELRLDPEVVRVDVVEFEEALAGGDLERAAELYGGPFLDGFFLPDAVELERRVDAEQARFRNAYRKALEGLAEAAAERGDASEAVGWWRRLAAEDPYNSRVTIELMKALESTGARAEAIRHARVHALLLEQELGARPDPAITALAERIRTDPAYEPEADSPAEGTGMRAPDGMRSAAAGSDEGEPPRAERQEPTAPVEPALPADLASGDDPAAAPSPRRRFRKRTVGLLVGAAALAIAGWAIVSALSGGAPEVDRMAVLPLANLTGDAQHDYFVAGMHDALVLELGRIADLTVISRQSVLRYEGSDEPLPAIARELGVDALVEGAVFLAGDSVRITAQLVRAEPEEHLWTDSYHGSLREALALQGEVARAIARAVHARLTPKARTRLAGAHDPTPEAQEAYLRGLYDLERVSLGTLESVEERREAHRTAISRLEEAAGLEPEWAAAHAKLALAHHWKASAFPELKAELVPKSTAAALRALELDPNEAQAHASLGFVRFFFEWDWDGAERAYRRALEVDPAGHHWEYALYLRAAGRYDEAVSHFRRAEERNPMSRALKRAVVAANFCAGRYDEAVAQAEHVAELWPEREGAARHGFLGNVHTVRSRHAEAIADFERAIALSDSVSWAISGLAYAHARAGDREEARRILAGHEDEGGPVVLFVALGEMERAVSMVEADFRERGFRALWDLRCFPEWQTLRAEPRIRAILDQVGLPT